MCEGSCTVDGGNPANQLRLVVYPIIYKVLYISQVVVWDFFHQQYEGNVFFWMKGKSSILVER